MQTGPILIAFEHRFIYYFLNLGTTNKGLVGAYFIYTILLFLFSSLYTVAHHGNDVISDGMFSRKPNRENHWYINCTK